MANIYDRWHKSRPKPGEAVCADHQLVPSAEHGRGDRWQVRWYDGHRQLGRNFPKRYEAERYLVRLDGNWCLVPHCRYSAVTEPPVLLCEDHRDLLIRQVTRRRPQVHDSLVYFIRNGSRIKIGWTTNLKARLSQLALPQSAVELQVDGGPEEEAILHKRFAKARVGRTEWFEATPELEAYIAQQQLSPYSTTRGTSASVA